MAALSSSISAKLKQTLLSETFVSFYYSVPTVWFFVPTHASIKTSSNFRSPSHVLLLPFQRFKVIPWLSPALFAVLDGLFGAVADARHAVGTVFAPERLSVFQMDIVQGAQLHALTAADAGIRCPEGIGFTKTDRTPGSPGRS